MPEGFLELTVRQKRIIELTKIGLSADLPGWPAQKVLSPFNMDILPVIVPNAMEASVMLLLQPSVQNDGFQVIYIKRGSKYGADKHKGQISFPGGKKEMSDISHLACALRETEEELGFDHTQITVLGALSEFYVFVSGFIVRPFVGYIPSSVEFVPDPDEVEYIIKAQLDDLLETSNLKYRKHQFGQKTIEKSPYFDIGNTEKLWGATAMMTNEYLSLLK